MDMNRSTAAVITAARAHKGIRDNLAHVAASTRESRAAGYHSGERIPTAADDALVYVSMLVEMGETPELSGVDLTEISWPQVLAEFGGNPDDALTDETALHALVWTHRGDTDALELFAPDGTYIDGDTIDAAEDSSPYEATETALLARHGLTRADAVDKSGAL